MAERTTPVHAFPVHADERGRLVVVEGEDVGFDVRRVFAVTGVDGGGPRGGHEADCTELLVLVAGTVRVRLSSAGGDATERLMESAGDALTVHPGDHVDYDLGGAASVLLVLCDAPYRSRA